MGPDDVIAGLHVPYCNFRCRRSGHWLLSDKADRMMALHIHDTCMGKECDVCQRKDKR